MKTKFKDRYVLATGYPGQGYDDNTIGMWSARDPWDADSLMLRCPEAIFHDRDVPRYRLVLERVK